MRLEYPHPMHLTLAHIGPRIAARAGSKDGFSQLTNLYLERSAPFARCNAEAFRNEQSFLEWIGKQQVGVR
jgi:hypothetical protein